jgi:hypothetical protein
MPSEGVFSVGGPGLVSGSSNSDNGGYSKNDGTQFALSVEYVSSISPHGAQRA